MNLGKEILIFLSVLVLAFALMVAAVAWRSGTFDKVLYPVGLNVKECAQNGYGATFCGDELKQYRRKVSDPLDEFLRR